jgi:type I restriction enzyme, S subunit
VGFVLGGYEADSGAVPPLQEQHAIARFLDHIDGRINRYIRAKRKLIALLNEQKQAIIHQAVTRGLDPDVPLKPSGVEWLGDIPTHWEVVSLRYLATKFGSGVTPRGGSAVYQDVGVPLLRSQNVHFEGLRLVGVARIPRDLHESLSATHVTPGDVLLNITGASIGRVCEVPDELLDANVNQHVCIIRPKTERILPSFLAAFLSIPPMQGQIRVEQTGASREGLTLQSIRSFEVLLPSVSEQAQIMTAVQNRVQPLVHTSRFVQDEIDLIREYRTRLIADVVTGKLDVRDVELPPEQDLGPEELEDEAADEWADEPADWQEEVDAGN